ncbi:TPA: hypothetical protein RMN47_000291 [Escherichia coli]|nr:hypothetical protein [Escherichia coli]
MMPFARYFCIFINVGLQETINLAKDACSKRVVKTVRNGELLASCTTPGFYSISIDDANTVNDFPKVHGTPIYSYGVMIVIKNDNTIEQLFISHKGHIATRQTWYGVDRYEMWVVQYSSINKPTHTELGLGDSASKNIGSATGTVAAGDDARFNHAIGISQSYQVMTSSRKIGITYINTQTRPIFVKVKARIDSDAEISINVDGVQAAGGDAANMTGGIQWVYPSAIVPPGSSYVASIAKGWGELIEWVELR